MEIPLGLGLITLVLLAIAVVNLFTKPAATVSGIIFSGLLFVAFEISEKRIQKAQRRADRGTSNSISSIWRRKPT